MSSRPDVRVRLSPQGVREVTDALRKVQAQGKRANQESARGITNLANAARKLGRFLPAIGVAGAVAGVTALGRQALSTADNMGKLAQVTGASTENLSIFSVTAERNNATLEEIRVSLVRLAEQLRALRTGNSAVAASFAELNLKAEDFIGLDTVGVAVKVAEALNKIEDPAKRTALAKAALGEAGARLLPTLKDLAEIGFEGARKRAEQLGLVITDDLVESTTAANDAMGDIGRQARGLGLAFVQDLAPQITQAMTTVQGETAGKGLSAVRLFGKGVGLVLNAVINLFRLLGSVVIGTLDIVGTSIGATLAAANQAIRGNFAEAKTIINEGFSDIDRINKERSTEIANNLQKLLDDLLTEPPTPEPPPDPDGGDDQIQRDKTLTKARLEQAKSRAQQELAILTERLAAESEANQRAYDQSLISLQAFTDKRQEILERQARAEIATLQLQRDAILEAVDPASIGPAADAERIAAQSQAAALDNQIAIRRLALGRELAALDAERADSAKSLAEEQRKTANDLAELEGRRHDAFQSNLEAEIRSIQELGQRADQTAEEIAAIVERITNARTTRFNFEEVTRAGSEALESFRRDAEQIRLDQEAGIISQMEGELRLIDLQRQRLEVLRQLAQQSLAAAEATGDPELIARAQAYAQSVEQIAASFAAATDTASQLRSAAIQAFEGGLVDLLSNIQDVESLEDAFKSLALTVARTMQQIAAEILARQAIFALLRAFGGGGGAAGAAVATGWTGGYVRGYASGGDIRGPALPIAGPDKYPILAAKGEFMLRRARVQEPGALSFLRKWNAGHVSLKQAMQLPRFERGGLIGATPSARPESDDGGGSMGRLRIINYVDKNLAIDALNTAGGERAVLNVIERNSEKISQLTSR